MTPVTFALVFALAGVLLLVAEVLLPSGGVLGIAGGVALAACVVACFRIDSRLGFAVSLAMVVAAPFAGTVWVKVWPKTFVGRRMILSPVSGEASAAAVEVGKQGVAVSELRPMGVCDFGAGRLEARADRGTIAAGTRVEVVRVTDRTPTVRVV